MLVSEMLIRRKSKIIVDMSTEAEAKSDSICMVASIVKNIESLGFIFSRKLLNVLSTYSKDDIVNFYSDLIPILRKIVGADKKYTPMYPNFPQSVANASEAELIINAIVHYLSFGSVYPAAEKEDRFPIYEDTKLTVLDIGTNEDVLNIFKNLLSSKTSLSEEDKNDIKYVMETFLGYEDYIPYEIPLKENVALFAKIYIGSLIEHSGFCNTSRIEHYFGTATDVLRLITAMSDGDISLAENTKFRSMRRCERRTIMHLLNNVCKKNYENALEDMYRHYGKWLRVGEIIHPSERCNRKYTEAQMAFDHIRNDSKPLFFGGKVHTLLNNKGNLDNLLNTVSSRPGEFARLLDKILRDYSGNEQDQRKVIECFSNVVNKVSTPVLIQVSQHFAYRNCDTIRVTFPKGNIAKPHVIGKNEIDIDIEICKDICACCVGELINRFSKKESLGKVYIDGELTNYLIPFNQRSASNGSKCVVRGSKIPISENCKAIRSFIWWTNNENRVDIDLSACFLDENWNFINHVSYTNLRDSMCKAYHSGDIVDGGNPDGDGVAEFIDIDVKSVNKDVRYVVFSIHSFTRQKFSELPNLRFGWMEREDVNSGEIFEPKTVKMSICVNSNATVAIPVIFDCKERKYIWCDVAGGYYSFDSDNVNNIESNLSGVVASCYAMANMRKMSIFDLVYLNARARGDIVTDRNDADIIFSNDTTKPTKVVAMRKPNEYKEIVNEDVPIITAFDFDYIVGNLM